MKYSKTGTLYSLKQKDSDWLVVSFANPFFGKEVGKGSEVAMKAFYELLTDGGRDALGFEYNGVQVVMPKIEISGLLGLCACRGHSKSLMRRQYLEWKLMSYYSDQRQKQHWNNRCIPSQTKPSCELGKAQKDFMARLGDL